MTTALVLTGGGSLGAVQVGMLRDHIADSRGLSALLARELRSHEFAQLQIPLHVISADLTTGESVVLSAGSLPEAILASTAIPGVFAPVSRDGRWLVDGAVAAETPISVAIRLGADRLFVLPCGFSCAGATVSRHALGRAMHAITLLGSRQLRQDFDRYSSQVQIHVVPPLCPLAQSAYDYSHGADLIRRAQQSTGAWVAAGGLTRSEFPGALQPHLH